MANIKKTPLELKQEALFRKHKKKLQGKANKKKDKQPKSVLNYATMPYNRYLKTKYWQRVREAVLKRDSNQCVICKSTTQLEIHHDTYKHRGNELNHLGDVLTLCRSCHKEHHYAQA